VHEILRSPENAGTVPADTSIRHRRAAMVKRA
jgi:hypothetical protein